jgi:enoyl-CoA hydratase
VADPADELVLADRHGPVMRLILNRPGKLNAMSVEVIESLSARLADAAGDETVRVVVIAGSGRAFCAGYDLDEETGRDAGSAHDYLSRDLRALFEVFDLPKPVIAEVHGYCLAGGCDLMMMCDLAVASDDAVFGVPELKFGSAVVAMVMPWLIGARRAKELLLTGEDRLGAVEAERIGLVNRVVARSELTAATMELAARLAVVDPVAMRLTKRAINLQWEAAGFRPALESAVAIGAVIESADVPERAEFERIRLEQGLAAAVAWRDQRFGV